MFINEYKLYILLLITLLIYGFYFNDRGPGSGSGALQVPVQGEVPGAESHGSGGKMLGEHPGRGCRVWGTRVTSGWPKEKDNI